MLRRRAVFDVAGPELLQVRDDVVEIAERFAQDEQHVEQRLPLPLPVDLREERPHPGRSLEEIVVEGPHQLVTLRSDEIEALLEQLYVDCHRVAPLLCNLPSARVSHPRQGETRPATY